MAFERESLPCPMTAAELLSVSVYQPDMILPPLFTTKTLALLHAPRGLGKTFFALSLARAVAAGEPFLGWQPPAPQSVLYVDGEMASADMQARVKSLGTPPPLLDFLVAEVSDIPLPDLAFPDGQNLFAAILARKRYQLVVLDSLASLTSFTTNDPDRWTELQRFLIRLRRTGFAVLLVHHSNRKGFQRGTDRREDVLDLMIALRRPPDYEPRQGARFEVHFEKARGVYGESVDPIDAHLTTDSP